jgi:hypothetical protein
MAAGMETANGIAAGIQIRVNAIICTGIGNMGV